MTGIKDIHCAISRFNYEHGTTLEKVLLPMWEFELYQEILNQLYPHVVFEGDVEIDSIVLIQRDSQ